MAEHTPGPWVVGGPYPGTSVCVVVDGGCGGEYPEPPVWEPICILDQRTEGEPNQQAQANARLIAAAPELLAALKGLETAMVQLGKEHHREVAVARAAILKAEGGAV